MFTRSIAVLFFVCLVCSSFTVYAAGNGGKTKIYTLPPEKILQYVKGKSGQKKILYIYTSWCPYCVKKMPGIMNLERTQKGSVIAISVDENYANYGRYAKKLKEPPFPLILNKGSESVLKKKLKNYVVKPWTGYPTIVFLDEDNKPVGQGNYSVDEAAAFLFSK
ncbi:MAG: TlpA family protein disulfide reductase [Alphaproteobacteria bacterium]